MSRVRALLLVMLPLPLALAGCTSLVITSGANARVLVTGLSGDEEVRLDVADQIWESPATGLPELSFHLVLPEGRHEARVEVTSEGELRCGGFVVEVGDGQAAVSVDARALPSCRPSLDAGAPDAGFPDAGSSDAGCPDPDCPDAGLPDAGLPDAGLPDAGLPDAGLPDAGVIDAGLIDAGLPDAGLPDAGPPPPLFFSIEETVTLLLGGQIVTTVEADGTITYDNLGLVQVGLVEAADLSALEAQVMSEDADTLFAGDDPDCQLPFPDDLDTVTLERGTIFEGELPEDAAFELVEVTGCSGEAQAIRDRLALLRLLVGF